MKTYKGYEFHTLDNGYVNVVLDGKILYPARSEIGAQKWVDAKLKEPKEAKE